MRILHTVEFYHPSVGGAQEVVKQVSERLVRRGHQVTVATRRLPERAGLEHNGVRIVEFPISGNTVNGINGPVGEYQDFLVNGDFDVMMNYAAQQWATDLAYPVLDRIPYRKVLAPCGFSGLHWEQFRNYFATLPDNLRRYDHLILHSDSYRDAAFLYEHGITHYTVVPNGTGADEFTGPDPTFRARYGIPEDVPLLLTVGSHTGWKGHKMAIQALAKAKIDRAVLVIVGNTVVTSGCLPSCRKRALFTNVTSLGRKQVRLLNPPRKDVVAAYYAADLFVFGSNIECSPLVLFEAMAAGTPFITLGAGNAAEIIEWGHGGILLPTRQRSDGLVEGNVDDMARAIERLLGDPAERKRLADNGFQAWQQRFSWEKIIELYEQVYRGERAAAPLPEGEPDVVG